MTTWITEAPGNYKFDLGNGHEVIVVHDGKVSRAHLHVMPMFWQTEDDVTDAYRAQALALPLEYVQREALEQSGYVLSDALKAVEAGLAALPRQPIGHAVRFVRPARPFAERAADFAHELRALTRRYGVAVDTIECDDRSVAMYLSNVPSGGTYETSVQRGRFLAVEFKETGR